MLLTNKYSPLIILTLLYCVIAALQLPIIFNIWQYSFDDGTYSHAFLIPVISVYLYFVLWEENNLIFREKLNHIAVGCLFISCYLLYVFTIAQFSTGYRIALILIISSSTAVIFRCTFKMLFPALFLIFLIPVWGSLTQTLQSLSTLAVTQLMALTAIPVFVEENFITIPEGVFEIAGGCSGLRYLIVSLAISSLYIFLNIKNNKHALLFLFFAIFGALFANWIRITLLILIGHYTNMESELMTDHNSFGWYIYIPYMMALFYFGQRLIDNSDTKEGITIIPPSLTKLSYQPLMSCLLLLVISSTYSKDLLLTSTKKIVSESCITKDTDSPQPTIHNYLKVCTVNNNRGQMTSYFFNAINLNNKADFYLNEFIPREWTLLKQEDLKTVQVNTLIKGNKYYLVSYSFISNGQFVSTPSAHKKVKLVNALKLTGNSSLEWQTTPCVDKCIQEISILKESLQTP
ncbi:MAG: exosortase A [Polaribacter sp.]